MKSTLFVLSLLAAGLAAHSPVHAQGSLLRILCEGNDIGAEVSVNGKFKGECPIDVQVPAGTVKIRALKVEGASERVFEKETRLGDGVVQKVEVILSGPRMSAEGQARENQRVATARLEASKRAQAREVALKEGLLPPRPELPIAIGEDIWRVIEESEAYGKTPTPRGIKISFQSSVQFDHTGSPRTEARINERSSDGTALSEKCSVRRFNEIYAGSGVFASYSCGALILGSTLNGKPNTVLVSLDEMTGSLFPIRIGARTSTRSQLANMADRKRDATTASLYEVTSQVAAQELDSRLTGTAWTVHCNSSYTSNGKTQVTELDDYFLADIGVMLSTIGVVDMSKKAYVMAAPGLQTVSGGGTGTTMITTYTKYDWSIVK